MRVSTFNVNSLQARMEQLERFVEQEKPDVLCIQETKLPDDRFPVDAIKALGFEFLVFTGQKSYNGVAMLSRTPITDPQTDFRDGDPSGEPRIVAGTVEGVRVYGLYCPNGTQVGSERYHGKLAWFHRLRAELDTHFSPTDPVLLTGDFNITPAPNDTWDPFGSGGKLLCTNEERAALTHLMEFGLDDAFRELNPYFVEFTWWDYQKMGFQRNHGLRIDHFLLTAPLMERAEAVTVHRDVRGWERPSDHAPVSLDLA
ncbi:MAG: exodeoxyribonuclease III [Myxococcales bacterium]|nr:exodeoxyribonuclease III [Myxococcales bacterium]MCB9670674.1 exodeoxyribonuclease III [Alphaproteobacteria bacterium]MCB9693764.1 exodeoxyribonuclease III [Alphaproteobacteria bacterium]